MAPRVADLPGRPCGGRHEPAGTADLLRVDDRAKGRRSGARRLGGCRGAVPPNVSSPAGPPRKNVQRYRPRAHGAGRGVLRPGRYFTQRPEVPGLRQALPPGAQCGHGTWDHLRPKLRSFRARGLYHRGRAVTRRPGAVAQPHRVRELMFDLVVQGGRMAHDGLAVRTVAIKDGKVAALLDAGEPAPARETFDASGCIVFPGLVDAHVHFREPGLTHKEDFESGSWAAALGGVTTVMVMPTDSPMTQTPEQFEEKRRLAEGRCHVDFALQALLTSDSRHVRALAALGAASFELFMGLLPEALCVRTEEALQAALAAVRAAGAVAGITALDERLSASFAPDAEAQGITRAL